MKKVMCTHATICRYGCSQTPTGYQTTQAWKTCKHAVPHHRNGNCSYTQMCGNKPDDPRHHMNLVLCWPNCTEEAADNDN
jgi:hypothetical protein